MPAIGDKITAAARTTYRAVVTVVAWGNSPLSVGTLVPLGFGLGGGWGVWVVGLGDVRSGVWGVWGMVWRGGGGGGGLGVLLRGGGC